MDKLSIAGDAWPGRDPKGRSQGKGFGGKDGLGGFKDAWPARDPKGKGKAPGMSRGSSKGGRGGY